MYNKKDSLLLFDIDGTLLITRGWGRKLYVKAVENVLKLKTPLDPEDIPWVGRLDKHIVLDLLRLAGINENTTNVEYIIQEVFKEFVSLFKEHFNYIKKDSTLLDGAEEAVKKFYKEYYIALATGNIEEIAYLKLSMFDLDKYFETGGFGSDLPLQATRVDLVKIAIEKSEKFFKKTFGKDKTVMIGDSPLDMWAAKENDIKAVGILTGINVSYEDLSKYSPSAIVKSFTELLKKDIIYQILK